MKSLILYHFSVVSKEIHASFQVIAAVNICCHDIIVGAVQQDFPKQLDALSLRHVGVGLDQNLMISAEEQAIIRR
jgi:hypothetical protein